MVEERAQRRLAAILAADVVGYSRLMGTNEAGTLAALKAHRNELMDSQIAEHGGRIVKLTGDGMLVEFRARLTQLPARSKSKARCASAMPMCPTSDRSNSALE